MIKKDTKFKDLEKMPKEATTILSPPPHSPHNPWPNPTKQKVLPTPLNTIISQSSRVPLHLYAFPLAVYFFSCILLGRGRGRPGVFSGKKNSSVAVWLVNWFSNRALGSCLKYKIHAPTAKNYFPNGEVGVCMYLMLTRSAKTQCHRSSKART